MALLLDNNPNPNNPYSRLIRGQKFALIPSFQLESGQCLENCAVAYKTWGILNDACDNVLVICHALSGSADVSDWWTPLIGPEKAFDPRHFFIFCGNVLGSPYGSASPLTVDVHTGISYASDFPQTTIRDDVYAHKSVLDALGVKSIAAVIGGSMGGMATLEWALCTAPGYVRGVIPIATAADHSAWGISWAEAQRQCIYADPKFENGYYEPTPESQPSMGLAAARMVAMLTYRSCVSFDNRFGRKPPRALSSPPSEPPLDLPRTEAPFVAASDNDIRRSTPTVSRKKPSFSAQGYLKYQGEKFVKRFDANCYLHLTNKMDSHDAVRGRVEHNSEPTDNDLRHVLARVPSGALVIGVETDALFLPEQQERLASCLPNASLKMLTSTDGHDGFLLEFEQLDNLIQDKLRRDYPHMYNHIHDTVIPPEEIDVKGESLVGEVEQW